jgi:beta-1,4-N-acetylglucosaminyltransferase
MLACWRIVLAEKPDLVLVNGPGTCIPICAASLLLRAAHVHDTRIAYVESIARVRSLSLSGKVLYHSRAADLLLVQWPELQAKAPRSHYVGRLM